MTICADCPATIKGKGKTGRCLSCSLRYTIKINPQLREAKRRAGRASAVADAAGRSARAKSIGLAAIGRAARTPESFAKLGRNVSAARMAWCPPELRDQARYLTNTKRIPAADVRRMILEQHEADMKRFSERLVAYG